MRRGPEHQARALEHGPGICPGPLGVLRCQHRDKDVKQWAGDDRKHELGHDHARDQPVGEGARAYNDEDVPVERERQRQVEHYQRANQQGREPRVEPLEG